MFGVLLLGLVASLRGKNILSALSVVTVLSNSAVTIHYSHPKITFFSASLTPQSPGIFLVLFIVSLCAPHIPSA